jgi:hypothetical protein
LARRTGDGVTFMVAVHAEYSVLGTQYWVLDMHNSRVAFLACVLASAAPSSANEPSPPGVVIDFSPAEARQYIGSPSIAILPDGSYVASHDFFLPGNTGDQTLVFRSIDRGSSWNRVGEIKGQWWSGLFVHRGALYVMGTSREYGACIVRRSLDGGATWTEPRDGKSGVILAEGKYHTSSMPVVVHEGRIWRAMEDGMGPGGWGSHFRAFVLSAPEDANLLNAANWTATNRVGGDPAWLDGRFGGWLEGNAIVTPQGKVVDILRVDTKTQPEKAAIVETSADGQALEFDPASGFIDFPGGAKKFSIRYDAPSKHYWSLVNWVLPRHAAEQAPRVRNTVALVRSPDLRTWEVRCVLLYHADTKFHGFQYADWLTDGDDLVAAVRTAYDEPGGQAHNQHDANYLTFHRWPRFRELTLADSVIHPSAIAAPPSPSP